jgi:hypothetical protein
MVHAAGLGVSARRMEAIVPLWKPKLDKAAAIRLAVDTGSPPPASRQGRFSARHRLFAAVTTVGLSMIGFLAIQTLGGPAIGLGSALDPDCVSGRNGWRADCGTPQRLAQKPDVPRSGDATASAPSKPKRAYTPKRPAAEAAPALAGIRLSPIDEEALLPTDASAELRPAGETEQRLAKPAEEAPSQKAARAKGYYAELERPHASPAPEATKVEHMTGVRLPPPRISGRIAPTPLRKPVRITVRAPQAQVPLAVARAFAAPDLYRNARYAFYPSPPSLGVAY